MGGPRRESNDRLKFVVGEREIDGWTLNVSEGGLRAIVDEVIELGENVVVQMTEPQPARAGRVVWIQEEPDGAIVGIEFTDQPPEGRPPSEDDNGALPPSVR